MKFQFKPYINFNNYIETGVNLIPLNSYVNINVNDSSIDSEPVTDANPAGIFFKSDGTVVYEAGNTDGQFYQYSLSTPWDITSNDWDQVVSGVSAQDTSGLTGLYIRPDGLILYECSYNSEKFFAHELSEAWEINSITYDTVGVYTQGSTPSGMYFKPDGLVLYESNGSDGGKFYQHTLSTPWDITSITYDTVGVSSQDGGPECITFSADGTKLYEAGYWMEELYQHTLSTPWDITSITLDTVGTPSTNSSTGGLFLKPDGTVLYEIGGGPDIVTQSKLSVEWDIASIIPQNDSKLIYLTSTSGFDVNSTVADLITATGNYTGIITDGLFDSPGASQLIGDTSPVLFSDLDAQGYEIQNVVLNDVSYRVVNTSDLEYLDTTYFVDLDGSNNYYCDLGAAGHELTFKLSPTTTITESKSITLILKNHTGYNVIFDSGSDFIVWDRYTPSFDGHLKVYIIEFNKRNGNWYGRVVSDIIDGAWDIYNIVKDTVGVSSQDTTPYDVFFKPDGTVLYELGNNGDKFYQHTLSTPWDITSITRDTVGVASQDTAPKGLFFKPDGTILYELGTGGLIFCSHTLSTPWDITSITYDTVGIPTQDVLPSGMFFKPDGTKLYESGTDKILLYQHTLSTPWDVTSITLDTVGVASQDTLPTGLFFKPDGTKLYEVGTNTDKFYQHTLSTPWDITSITYDTVGVATQDGWPHGIFIKPDGTVLYEAGAITSKLYQHQIKINN